VKPVPLIGGAGLVKLEELPSLVDSILGVFDVIFSILLIHLLGCILEKKF
jgi:hypothetical protein